MDVVLKLRKKQVKQTKEKKQNRTYYRLRNVLTESFFVIIVSLIISIQLC